MAVEANGVRTLYVSGQVGPGETLAAQSRAAYGNRRDRMPAHALVGVQALYSPRAMLEAEAVAVVAAE